MPKRRLTIQERIRPQAKKKHRVAKPKPPKIHYVTGSEIEFAGWLRRYCVEFLTQASVTPFDIDLTGHGMTQFQPDFYLPYFDVYVEVTEGKSERVLGKKRAKIHAARRAGKTVYLVTATDLRRLRDGEAELFDFIDPVAAFPRPPQLEQLAVAINRAQRASAVASKTRFTANRDTRPQQPRSTAQLKPRLALVAEALNEAAVTWRFERHGYPLSDGTTFRADFYLTDLKIGVIVTTSTCPSVLAQRARQIELLAKEHNRECLLIGHEDLEALKHGQFALLDLLTQAA